MNDTLKDFSTGNGTNVSSNKNETSEQQTNSQHNDFQRFVDTANQNQIIDNDIDDKIRKAVENAAWTVENRMNDAILTAMDKVLIPRFETAVKSITDSSTHGLNSEVQKPDRGIS